MISEDLERTILEFQRKEITEHEVYRKLAEKTRGKNAEVLKRISNDELHHYNDWKKYTQQEVHPDRLAVLKYSILSTIFGLTFVMKIMEGGEEKAQEAYNRISSELPEATQLVLDEHEHETLLIEMIDEKRLDYISSMVQGLNDALIELAGELAGFTFALQNPRLIGFAGLIAGIAQFLSSSASEIEIYLSRKTEENRRALKASFHEGTVYMLTVLLLIIPYFISTSYHMPLLVTVASAFLIILFFTYYVSVVKSLSLKRMFFTIVTITLGVGGVAFLIGWIAKTVLNL
jgi:VIT1/CCC1 family predicted Fe2+/Mn2+ transporter